jgi:hypothetical protein
VLICACRAPVGNRRLGSIGLTGPVRWPGQMPAVGGAPWDDLRVLLKGISNVAVSGAFGQAFSRIYAQQFSSVAVFPGGLTAKRGWEPHGPRHWKSAQPAGDSHSLMIVYTREGTYDHITSAIRLVGGEVDGAAVIYDGSPIRRQEVKSLYRCYCDGLCGSYHSSRRGGSRLPFGGVARRRSPMGARGSSVCANHMGGPLRISPERRFPDRW